MGVSDSSESTVDLSLPSLGDRSMLSEVSSRNPFHEANAIGANTLADRQAAFLKLALNGACGGASIVYLLKSLCPSHADTVVEKTVRAYNATKFYHEPPCTVK